MDEKRLEAAKRGDKKYIGKPCRSCGAVERFVGNNSCTACAEKHSNKHRAKIKEILAKAKAGEL